MVSLEPHLETTPLYNDWAEFPTTPLLQHAEREYRKAFYDSARIAASWLGGPDHDYIERCWSLRKRTRAESERIIPSAEVFGDPRLSGEQVLYLTGHEGIASRARGRVQALEIARQYWEQLESEGVPVEVVGRLVMKPWSSQVAVWAEREIDPAKLEMPPLPENCIPPENRQRLDEYMNAKGNKHDGASAVEPLRTKSVRQLINECPELRRPLIHGLLREGETMNVIASPKVGKSWLVLDLALAVATGRRWLDAFECERGDVLIIDNELHQETSAHRIPKVMNVRNVELDEAADAIHVANVRGELKDIFSLGDNFLCLDPGRFKLVILDAFYRVLPKDTDENDNGTMAQVYNHLDAIAARLGCAFVLVHHSSKGNQSGKAVTDVGAGAGSQSRATDTHLILRPHEENDAVVLDAAVRSWPPIEPQCLRWQFPVWTPDDSLDPAALRPERPRRRAKAETKPQSPPPPDWDAERFVEAFVSETPATILDLTGVAMEAGLSERKAGKLLKQAESKGLIYRWRFGATHPVKLATIPQPEDS